MILKFKNGSSINIKESNKGKFTEYCGGKVTSECIAKGKRSPDPKIRKRATFADNARKFKHRNGGPIAPKAEDRYKGGTRVEGYMPKVNLGDMIANYSRFEPNYNYPAREVIAPKTNNFPGTHPAIIREVITPNNDTIYSEAPQYNSFRVLNPKYRIGRSGKEKEILRRRFYEAWNVAH